MSLWQHPWLYTDVGSLQSPATHDGNTSCPVHDGNDANDGISLLERRSVISVMSVISFGTFRFGIRMFRFV